MKLSGAGFGRRRALARQASSFDGNSKMSSPHCPDSAATIGYALVAGALAYLVFKFVRLWRYHRAHGTHRMSPAELKHRMEAGDPVVVVDLRTELDRQDGRIPGARLLIARTCALVPVIATKEVVFYCSCPNELASIRAALRLKRHGITHALAPVGALVAFPWIRR